MSAYAKVFCIGFQKTGTTSLYAALTKLGYRTASVIGRNLSADALREQAASLCLEEARNFDAVQDMPWPLFFRELDQEFPGSKFILTVRNSETWFGSIEGHFGKEDSPMQAFIYGDDAATPAGNRARYISVYETHNEEVRRHFAGRQRDLLIMDLSAGDGWGELCPFLGRAIPDEPFPRKNTSKARRTFAHRIRRKLLLLAGQTPAPERLA